MKLKINIILAIALLGIVGCTDYWEDHYDVYPETVNTNVWEALQNNAEISHYISLLKEFQYDTLFQTDIAYTLFIPTNDALNSYQSENEVNQILLNYLISPHLIHLGSVNQNRKIQTLGEKFALFEDDGTYMRFDGVPLIEESSLYKNGKFFVMDEVPPVKLNIYEYYKIYNPMLREYIDSQDSVVLDRERSKPIGFDEQGRTVYDSVTSIYNKFEHEYFAVSQEFRNNTATIVFPIKEDYEEALTVMAQNMNVPAYTDHNDIPIHWQNTVLIPSLLEQGVFENMLEPEEFLWKTPIDTARLKNIKGDSVNILYTPVDKAIASNGYAYNYQDFSIPTLLYNGIQRFEAEYLLRPSGVSRYVWRNWVKVQSSTAFIPTSNYLLAASNDSVVSVLFPLGYRGTFSVEFNSEYLFPRRYRMEVRTHMYYGGIYNIYVNDKLVKTFDYFDFVLYRTYNYSVTGARFIPRGNYNSFDMWVDNIHEYGQAKIRFEYVGPGMVANNGFIIDYIDFIPVGV